MAKSRTAELKLLLQLKDDMSNNLRKADDSVNSFKRSVKNVAGIVGGAFAVAEIKRFGQELLNASKDAEETRNKFNQVFGNLNQQAKKFTNDLARSVGRSTIQIKEGITTFQSFAVGLGFGRKKALKMSKALQTMSIDFASFNNISDGEAQRRFISAMSGSAEVLDKFGINIKAAALEQELLNMGIDEGVNQASEMQKAQARLNVIMESMTEQGALGDAVRTSEAYANKLKRLDGKVKDLKASVGDQLKPAMTTLVDASINAIGAAEGQKTQSSLLADTLNRLANIAVGLGKSFNLIINLMKNVTDAFVQSGKAFFTFAEGVLSATNGDIIPAGQAIARVLKGDVQGAMEAVKKTSFPLQQFKSDLNSAMAASRNISTGLVKDFDNIVNQFENMGDSSGKNSQQVKKNTQKQINSIKKLLGELNGELDKNSKNQEKNSKKTEKTTKKNVKNLKNMVQAYRELEKDGRQSIKNLAKEHSENIDRINGEIDDLNKKINEAQENFSETKTTERQGVAKEIIEAEKNIQSLKDELKQTDDDAEEERIRAKLKKQQQAFKDTAKLRERLSEEVAEARRRANLTELERAVEDFNKRIQAARKKKQKRIKELKAERRALQQEKKKEKKIFQKQREKIEKIVNQSRKRLKKNLQKASEFRKKTIKAEIDLFDQLGKTMDKIADASAENLKEIKTNIKDIAKITGTQGFTLKAPEVGGGGAAKVKGVNLNKPFNSNVNVNVNVDKIDSQKRVEDTAKSIKEILSQELSDNASITKQ